MGIILQEFEQSCHPLRAILNGGREAADPPAGHCQRSRGASGYRRSLPEVPDATAFLVLLR